jgi:UDP-glucose 4-epimerase
LAYWREKKIDVIVVRLFNVIGRRQSGAYGMVVPRFVKQAMSGEPITVYNDGSQTRCFTDVRDVVGALIKLLDCKKACKQIINLGSSKEINIMSLAKTIKKITGSKSKIICMPYSILYGNGFTDMMHRRADLKKINDLIDYNPKFSLDESLRWIINSFEL